MPRPRARLFGALALIAAATTALSGCVLIQHVTGEAGDSVSAQVPDGLVDDATPAELVRYYEQDLRWGECDREFGYTADRECATAIAPMDWNAPDAHPDIELALVRVPASGSRAPQGTLFTNPGGPGSSGADFVGASAEGFFSKDLRAAYDIVGWDPRGVGRSSAVTCVDDAGLDRYFYGVPDPLPTTDQEWSDYRVQAARDFGEACEQNTGELLGYIDTVSTVHDLDLLRALVGDTQLTYFGLSYGTDIGAKYIDQFPERVRLVVLDGATDPTVPMFDVVIDQQEKFAEATRNYLADCLAAAGCPFTGTVDDAMEEIVAMMTAADASMPRAPDGRRLTSAVMGTAISAAMYDEGSWPYLTDAFTSWKQQSDSSGFFLLSDSYYGRDQRGRYDSNMFEAFIAINCIDYPLVTDPAAIADYNKRLSEVSPFTVSEIDAADSGDVQCENWPVPPKVTEQLPVHGTGAAPVLVVATTNDPATPYKWAAAVAEQLESGVLFTFEGEGHIAYDAGSACVVSTVDAYLIDGKVPAEGASCG